MRSRVIEALSLGQSANLRVARNGLQAFESAPKRPKTGRVKVGGDSDLDAERLAVDAMPHDWCCAGNPEGFPTFAHLRA